MTLYISHIFSKMFFWFFSVGAAFLELAEVSAALRACYWLHWILLWDYSSRWCRKKVSSVDVGLCSVVYGRSGFIARREVGMRKIQKLMGLGCVAVVKRKINETCWGKCESKSWRKFVNFCIGVSDRYLLKCMFSHHRSCEGRLLIKWRGKI